MGVGYWESHDVELVGVWRGSFGSTVVYRGNLGDTVAMARVYLQDRRDTPFQEDQNFLLLVWVMSV